MTIKDFMADEDSLFFVEGKGIMPCKDLQAGDVVVCNGDRKLIISNDE